MKERKHPAELQSCIGRTVNWSWGCHEKDGLVWHNWKQKDMRQPSLVTSVFIYWLVPWSNEAMTKPTETPGCIFAPHQINDLGLQFPQKVEKTKSLIFYTMQGRFPWNLRCIAPPLKWNMRKENTCFWKCGLCHGSLYGQTSSPMCRGIDRPVQLTHNCALVQTEDSAVSHPSLIS
jgi:hypothetical protein